MKSNTKNLADKFFSVNNSVNEGIGTNPFISREYSLKCASICELEQLKLLIEYIIWNYDVNVSNIADVNPKVIVENLVNTWVITILCDGNVTRDSQSDPTIVHDDKIEVIDHKFILLKTEGFRPLTKYVEDICDEIAKIEV